jgi:hypothetical protein
MRDVSGIAADLVAKVLSTAFGQRGGMRNGEKWVGRSTVTSGATMTTSLQSVGF